MGPVDRWGPWITGGSGPQGAGGPQGLETWEREAGKDTVIWYGMGSAHQAATGFEEEEGASRKGLWVDTSAPRTSWWRLMPAAGRHTCPGEATQPLPRQPWHPTTLPVSARTNCSSLSLSAVSHRVAKVLGTCGGRAQLSAQQVPALPAAPLSPALAACFRGQL